MLLLLCPSAFAETIFEGYYKITMAGSPIGYLIQRYDLNPKEKQFVSTYYMYTKTAEATSVESLKATATSTLEPISYQYTSLSGKTSKVTDAVVTTNKNKKRHLLLKTIINGGKATTKDITLGDNTFFSTFLSHLMLNDPKGIQVGNKFSYEAVLEEDGTVEKGEVYVKSEEKEKGISAFRLLNTIKKGKRDEEQFISTVNIKGEALKTHVPVVDLVAELMSDPKEAHKNMEFNSSTIKLLFGNIPEGKINMLNKK